MGNTPIYGWRYPDLPTSADGPAGIGNLGRDIEVTVNDQNTRRVYYTLQKNFTVGVGTTSLGGWTNAGGFVGNTAGITVPEAGIYIIYLAAINLSRAPTNGSTSFQITIGGGAQTYFQPAQVNAFATYLTAMTAGGQLNMSFENHETVSFTALMMLNIAKVAA